MFTGTTVIFLSMNIYGSPHMSDNSLIVGDKVVNKIDKGPLFIVIPFWERKDQKVLTENKLLYKSMNDIIPDSNKC